jgi:nitrogenase cofactor biosynthesis protein NifB
MTPAEAFEWYKELKKTVPNLTVAGVAGPGEALANIDETLETLRLVRSFDPDVTLCVATNGLLLPRYLNELKELGLSHVTVTINAVDIGVGAKIYKYVDYEGARLIGEEGASILLENQLEGVGMLAAAGIVCKVNCVAVKGVNDAHIPEITKKAAQLGAFMTNILPHIPVKGTAFEDLERLSGEEIEALRLRCGANIKQMTHCRQCRSDAVGTLG